MPSRSSITLIMIGGALFLLGLLLAWQISMQPALPVQAAPLTANLSQGENPDPLSISNDVCLGCHGKPGQTMNLDNGEILDLYVSPDDYRRSIHGERGYACVQCHAEVGNYPHPAFTAASLREVTLKLTAVTCKRCHAWLYDLTADSVHAAALAAGKTEAAVCTDCHGAHTTWQVNDPLTRKKLPSAHLRIPQTCAKCHYAIYQKYQSSVHGAALTEENNLDVPTCIDCHGVHNIANPTTAAFHIKSPQICAKCHSNAQLMAKYGISTQVTKTYVADFHGTTVTIFDKQTPDAETNKAVCFDCHGVHDIQRTNDAEAGLKMKQNLLVRCQTCHPQASQNFSDAWLSHYIPSAEKHPLVYYVDLFYKIFIPLVLGGMAALVALDFGHSIYTRYFKNMIRISQPIPEDKDSKHV